MNFSKRTTPQSKYCFSSSYDSVQNSSFVKQTSNSTTAQSASTHLKNVKKPSVNESKNGSSFAAFGRAMPQRLQKQQPVDTNSRGHRSMAGPPQQTHENDFRCEFELPKFVDLRQTMVTRSQKASMLPSADGSGRETAVTRATDSRKSTLLIQQNQNHDHKEDFNYDWFQQDHDFKIMTRAQMQQIERLKLRPKLNSTAPIVSKINTSTSSIQASKKRTWKEATRDESSAISQPRCEPLKKRTVEQIRSMVDQQSTKSMKNTALQRSNQKRQIEFKQPLVDKKPVQTPSNQVASGSSRNFIELNKQRIRDQSAKHQQEFANNNASSTIKNSTASLVSGPTKIVESIKNKISSCIQTLTRSVSQTSRIGKQTASAKSSAHLQPLDLSVRVQRKNKENGAAAISKVTAFDAGKSSVKSQSGAFGGFQSTTKLAPQSRSMTTVKRFNASNAVQDGAVKQRQAFLYEPTLISSKILRTWQQKTGVKYYDLSPQSRNQMNVAIKNQGLDGAVSLYLNENQQPNVSSAAGSKPATVESKRITRSGSKPVSVDSKRITRNEILY